MFQNDNVIYQFRGPFGVRVEIGQSLGVLVALLLYLSLRGNFLDGAIFAVFLIGSIFLHELGHAWGCMVQGIPVRRILLHGGGGVCERSRSATRYEQELIVAMGPIVNLAIWALASLAEAWLWYTYNPADGVLWIEFAYHLSVLAWLNLALVIFNMIPVQPLDGGKLFQLLMLRVTTPDWARRFAGAVGLLFAVAWIPAMIFAYMAFGWILFFVPSIMGHYRMLRGELV